MRKFKSELIKAISNSTGKHFDSSTGDITIEDFLQLPWVRRNQLGAIYVIPQLLAIYIKANYIIQNNYGNLYIYENGCYRLKRDNEWRAFIKAFMPEEYRKKRNWDDVLEELKTDYPISTKKLNADENIINFKNGILNISTGELMPHDPKYLSTIQIPCNYVSGLTLDDAPVTKRFLTDLCTTDFGYFDQDVMTLLLEVMGAVFSNVKGSRYKKCLILHGPGNTGKTQLRQLVISLVGKENTISVDLGRMQDKFGTSELPGKRLAGSGDMAYAKVSEMNILKALTGGDDTTIEGKYQKMKSEEYNGFLWYNCNQLPKFGGDRGEHLYERFMLVPCTNVIPLSKRDPAILDKMLTEKEAIVSVAIEYFKKSVERGYRFTEGETVDMERDKYETYNNSLLYFVSSYCIIPGGMRTARTTFNKVYSVWCRDNNFKPETQTEIGKILETQCGISPVKINGKYYYELEVDYENLDRTENSYLLGGNYSR